MNYIEIEKMKWHSRRSILELDLYFERFLLDDGLNKLSEDELLAYQALLECDDSDLLVLLLGKDKVNDKIAQRVVEKIRSAPSVLIC